MELKASSHYNNTYSKNIFSRGHCRQRCHVSVLRALSSCSAATQNPHRRVYREGSFPCVGLLGGGLWGQGEENRQNVRGQVIQWTADVALTTAPLGGLWKKGEVSQHLSVPCDVTGIWLFLHVLFMGINTSICSPALLVLPSGASWHFFILWPHQGQILPQTPWAPFISAGSSCATTVALTLNTLLPYWVAATADLVHRRNVPRDITMATQHDSRQSHYHLSLSYQLTASRTSQKSL